MAREVGNSRDEEPPLHRTGEQCLQSAVLAHRCRVDTEMVEPLFPIERRWQMLQPTSVVPTILYLATAPRAAVHGRIFEQLELTQAIAHGEAAGPLSSLVGKLAERHGLARH